MLDTVKQLLKFNVLNRFSGNVQFTAEIDCAPDASDYLKMGLAVSWAIKSRSDLRGADLRGAYLRDANLRGADLRGAYLRDANLRGADLVGADLVGADLRGADLRDANLRGQWIIQGATRSDGYAFFLQKLKDDTEPMIKAGCRHFSLAEAQQHWEQTRAGTMLFTETREIVRCMVDIAHARGLMKNGKAV